MERWSWSDVWLQRLERHWLISPASATAIEAVVGDVCGIHAQVAASAELSLGLRVDGVTRQDVRSALWDSRTLTKTVGPRSTLHLFATRDLPLWLAALRARVPPRPPTDAELQALSYKERDQVIGAIYAALDGQQLTHEELEREIRKRLGAWATESIFPAFGGQWPRWRLALGQAAADGLIVYGPNRGVRVTFVRTDQWLGQLPHVDGDRALREVCKRFVTAYGPATHVEFARWLGTTPAAARELMAQLNLVEVDVEGWRAWAVEEERHPAPDAENNQAQAHAERGDLRGRPEHNEPAPEPEASEPTQNSEHNKARTPPERSEPGPRPEERGEPTTKVEHNEAAIRLLPPFDCYVVGCFPRVQLIPDCAPAALRKGTAAPFAVMLVDGVIGGIWERRRRGQRLELRVAAFATLSSDQRVDIEREAARIGEILELQVEVEFGHVEPRRHL